MAETDRNCPVCQQPTDAPAYRLADYSYLCQACRRARQREQYAANPEPRRKYSREYSRERPVNPQKREYARQWAQSPIGREKRRAWAHSPEQRPKNQARKLAENAVKRGALVPQPCERCGAATAEKHHPDYSQPLAVRWLCRRCHGLEHRYD